MGQKPAGNGVDSALPSEIGTMGANRPKWLYYKHKLKYNRYLPL